MNHASLLLGIKRLWPKLLLFGAFALLVLARASGEAAVRVGPSVLDIAPWWIVLASAVAFFVSPTSGFDLRRDVAFWLTLLLLVTSALLWTGLKESGSAAPAKTVTVYRDPGTAVETYEVGTETLRVRNRRHLNRLAGRRQVVALELDGYVRVPESGSYRFEARCVSRCAVRVGDEIVLDGAGFTTGEVELESGVERLWLRYERGGAPAEMELSWDRPAFVELVGLDDFVSDRVGLLSDASRLGRERRSALWVLQGTLGWLGVLGLVLWSGAKLRHRFVQSPTSDAIRAAARLLLWGSLAAAHVFLVVRLIGPGPLLRGEPLIQDDYSYHLSSAIRVREFFAESGRVWGYSPTLMAGFPAGTLDSTSNRAAEAAVALFRFVPAEQAFAFFLAVLFSIPPLVAYGATRGLGGSRGAALLSAVVGALLFYGFLDGRSAYVRWGMYSHAIIVVLAPLVGAAFLRLLEEPGWRRAALAGLGLGFGTSVHILFPLTVAPPVMAATVPIMKKRDRAWVLYGFAAVLLGVVVNLPWIPAFLAFRDSISQVPMLGHFPGGPAALFVRATSWTYALTHVVWIIGVLGLPAFARARGAPAALLSGTAAAFLLFLGTVGYLLPVLETIEPGRFLDGVAFFLLPPAAEKVYGWLGQRRARSAVAAVALLVIAYPSVRNWALVVGPERRGSFIVWEEDGDNEGLPADVPRLIRRLRTVTTPEARIMIEDADHLDKNQHAFGFTHLPAFFPHLLGRELIGGPMECSRVAHHWVDFTSGRAFGRPIDDFRDDELGDYLRLYNVGWIVAWSDVARRDLERRPFVRQLETVGKYVLFEVDGPHTFAVGQPRIRVEAGADTIAVLDAEPGRTVLKYHCMPGLRTHPPLPIECSEALDDPIGFIAVENGEITDFTVVLDP